MIKLLLAITFLSLTASSCRCVPPQQTKPLGVKHFNICDNPPSDLIHFWVDEKHHACFMVGYHELAPIDCAIVEQCLKEEADRK